MNHLTVDSNHRSVFKLFFQTRHALNDVLKGKHIHTMFRIACFIEITVHRALGNQQPPALITI